MSNQPTAAKTYSPFWALCLVFATLITLQIAYVINDIEQRSQIRVARAQLQPMLNKAQTISQTTEAVGRDLVTLSTSSAEAAKIIAEFKIQLNKPAEAKK